MIKMITDKDLEMLRTCDPVFTFANGMVNGKLLPALIARLDAAEAELEDLRLERRAEAEEREYRRDQHDPCVGS